MSLLTLGTVALDSIKTPSGVKKDMLGGSAAHLAMAARLFTKVTLVGIVGKDFPSRHTRFLKKKKVNLSLEQANGKTFRWSGEYKKENLNIALTHATELGVLADYDPQIHPDHRNIPYVFLANIDPDVQMHLLKLMRSPKLVGLDSMNLWINHKRKSLLRLMKSVDLFVANDAEARSLSGEHNLIKAAKRLHRMGPRLIVVKKGEHGVLFYSKEFSFSFPAYPIEDVIDPTGAGDTFAGGLMGYIAKKKSLSVKTLKEAVLTATAIASFNVEAFGLLKTSRLTMRDVKQRMNKLIKFIAV